MEQGVNTVGRSRLGPVARFSITLAAILVVTAVALAAMTNALLDRYVQDETARFTEVTVASHFGVIFQDDVFQRPLHDDEREPAVPEPAGDRLARDPTAETDHVKLLRQRSLLLRRSSAATTPEATWR